MGDPSSASPTENDSNRFSAEASSQSSEITHRRRVLGRWSRNVLLVLSNLDLDLSGDVKEGNNRGSVGEIVTRNGGSGASHFDVMMSMYPRSILG